MTLPPQHQRFISFCLLATLFLLAVAQGLLIPIYSGLLSYGLVILLANRWLYRARAWARWVAVTIITAFVIMLLFGLGLGLHLLLQRGNDLNELLREMGNVLASGKNWLPPVLGDYLPEPEYWLANIGIWLKEHAAVLGFFGLDIIKGLAYALVGILLGAMVSLSATREHRFGPVTEHAINQIFALCDAFWRVLSAQVRISAFNTVLTGLYLLLVLPLFNVHLPFTKTLILLTFVTGLLPVIGNIISNSVITIISLQLGAGVALGSLAFLVVIHKLEYFVNARFIGSRINARAWELLLWMIILERLFGPAGVVAAPVFYAWLKAEWTLWDAPTSTVLKPPSKRKPGQHQKNQP